MAQKMIYVKDEDQELFDRAAEIGGDSLSAVIAEALERFVAAKEAEAVEQGVCAACGRPLGRMAYETPSGDLVHPDERCLAEYMGAILSVSVKVRNRKR